MEKLLYEKESYEIRGACFWVRKEFGSAFKESVVDNAITEELKKRGLHVESQKRIDIYYQGKKVGTYIPDKVINNAIIIEMKAKPFLTKQDIKQFWHYLKGTNYKLGFLINFGNRLEIKRVVYDKARNSTQVKHDPHGDRRTEMIRSASAPRQKSAWTSAFTLIELIIYLAIISGIAVSFVYFSISITNTRAKTYVVQEVHANARTALELIAQRIRASQGVNLTNSGNNILTSPVLGPVPAISAGDSIQRKIFWDSGNNTWWTFFNNGSAIEFSNSSNGTTWISRGTIGVNAIDFSVWHTAGSSDVYLVYKNIGTRVQKGILSPTGITWPPLPDTVDTDPDNKNVFIAQDTQGYLWVVYSDNDGANTLIFANRSTNLNDTGSWNTQITIDSAPPDSVFLPLVVPLDAPGIVYFLWARGEATDFVKGRRWSGSLEGIQTVDNPPGFVSNLSAVISSTDTIHILYSADSGRVKYAMYSGGVWGTPLTIDSGTSNLYPTLTIDTINNTLYAFWIRGSDGNIVMKRAAPPYGTANWDAVATSLVTAGVNKAQLTSAYHARNSFAGFMWREGTNPYTINFYGVNTKSGTSISLGMVDLAKNPTILDVDANGIVRIKEGAASPVPITSDEVKAKKLGFTIFTTGARENVLVNLTLEYDNPSGDAHYNYSKSFQTTVSVRQ